MGEYVSLKTPLGWHPISMNPLRLLLELQDDIHLAIGLIKNHVHIAVDHHKLSREEIVARVRELKVCVALYQAELQDLEDKLEAHKAV